MKFYKCNHCNQIIFKIKDVNVPVSCCGEKMEEIIEFSELGDFIDINKIYNSYMSLKF